MKIKLLLFILGLSFLSATAQFGPQQIISTSTDFAIRAIPYDMDQDGFTDVVSASHFDGKIAWFKNLDGLGDFSNEIIISDGILALEGMELFDLNSDGYLDVIYKTNLDKIAWLENLNGQGSFGTEQIIADTNHPYTINVADIDNDGDMDVFANLYHNTFNNRFVWYENMDGQGNFSDENLIEMGDFSASILLNFDLDNDGDQDFITSYEGYPPSKLIWYENLDGQGTFAEAQEIYQFNPLQSDWTSINNLANSDINGDGKIDLLVITNLEEFPDHIYWLENLDEQGNFGQPQLIHVNETIIGTIRTYDLDNDSDNDILVSFSYGASTRIAWFENLDGLGDFGSEQIISTEVDKATDATAADINGDDLPDVISASATDDKIAWYENGFLGIEENKENNFKLYPNPTQGKLQIHTNQEIILVEVYNLVGQKVLETKTEINLTNFESGIYFIKIKDSNGFSEVHKIIKE